MPLGKNGQGSLHRGIWMMLNLVFRLRTRGPTPNPGATDSMQPTHPCWATPFSKPLRTSFCRGIWEVFAFCSLPRSFPGGSVYRGTGTTTDLLGACRAGSSGPWETQDQTSEPTFQSSICLPIPASPARLHLMLRDRKNEDLEPNSHSPLSRQASASYSGSIYIIRLSSFN